MTRRCVDVAGGGNLKYTILAPIKGGFQRQRAGERGRSIRYGAAGDLSLAVFRFERELSSEYPLAMCCSDGGIWRIGSLRSRSRNRTRRGDDDRDRR